MASTTHEVLPTVDYPPMIRGTLRLMLQLKDAFLASFNLVEEYRDQLLLCQRGFARDLVVYQLTQGLSGITRLREDLTNMETQAQSRLNRNNALRRHLLNRYSLSSSSDPSSVPVGILSRLGEDDSDINKSGPGAAILSSNLPPPIAAPDSIDAALHGGLDHSKTTVNIDVVQVPEEIDLATSTTQEGSHLLPVVEFYRGLYFLQMHFQIIMCQAANYAMPVVTRQMTLAERTFAWPTMPSFGLASSGGTMRDRLMEIHTDVLHLAQRLRGCLGLVREKIAQDKRIESYFIKHSAAQEAHRRNLLRCLQAHRVYIDCLEGQNDRLAGLAIKLDPSFAKTADFGIMTGPGIAISQSHDGVVNQNSTQGVLLTKSGFSKDSNRRYDHDGPGSGATGLGVSSSSIIQSELGNQNKSRGSTSMADNGQNRGLFVTGPSLSNVKGAYLDEESINNRQLSNAQQSQLSQNDSDDMKQISSINKKESSHLSENYDEQSHGNNDEEDDVLPNIKDENVSASCGIYSSAPWKQHRKHQNQLAELLNELKKLNLSNLSKNNLVTDDNFTKKLATIQKHSDVIDDLLIGVQSVASGINNLNIEKRILNSTSIPNTPNYDISIFDEIISGNQSGNKSVSNITNKKCLPQSNFEDRENRSLINNKNTVLKTPSTQTSQIENLITPSSVSGLPITITSENTGETPKLSDQQQSIFTYEPKNSPTLSPTHNDPKQIYGKNYYMFRTNGEAIQTNLKDTDPRFTSPELDDNSNLTDDDTLAGMTPKLKQTSSHNSSQLNSVSPNSSEHIKTPKNLDTNINSSGLIFPQIVCKTRNNYNTLNGKKSMTRSLSASNTHNRNLNRIPIKSNHNRLNKRQELYQTYDDSDYGENFYPNKNILKYRGNQNWNYDNDIDEDHDNNDGPWPVFQNATNTQQSSHYLKNFNSNQVTKLVPTVGTKECGGNVCIPERIRKCANKPNRSEDLLQEPKRSAINRALISHRCRLVETILQADEEKLEELISLLLKG